MKSDIFVFKYFSQLIPIHFLYMKYFGSAKNKIRKYFLSFYKVFRNRIKWIDFSSLLWAILVKSINEIRLLAWLYEGLVQDEEPRSYLAPPLPPVISGGRLRRVNSSTLSLNKTKKKLLTVEELYVEVLYTILHMIGCDIDQVEINKWWTSFNNISHFWSIVHSTH